MLRANWSIFLAGKLKLEFKTKHLKSQKLGRFAAFFSKLTKKTNMKVLK